MILPLSAMSPELFHGDRVQRKGGCHLATVNTFLQGSQATDAPDEIDAL